MCLAVAKWIEQRSDSAAGCGFESRQPGHTLEALGFSHLGLLCLCRWAGLGFPLRERWHQVFELLALTAVIYLFLNRKKRVRKARGIDAEYRELVESTYYSDAMAAEIKGYLLSVVADDRDGAEKFSDARLAQAQSILDRAGPGALYWMTDIATQLAVLSASKINGMGTNVEAELGSVGITPDAVVRVVVKG